MLFRVMVFLHLGFVLGLCCTLCVEWTTLSGMRRTNEAAPFRAWSRQLQVIERFHPLWAVGILATGAYLTTTAWTWSTAFIGASLFAVVASAVIGGAFNGPRFKRLDTASAALETDVLPAALRKDVNAPSLLLAHGAQTGVTLSLFYIMTVKPDWVGSIAALALGAGAGLAAAMLMGRAALSNPKEHR